MAEQICTPFWQSHAQTAELDYCFSAPAGRLIVVGDYGSVNGVDPTSMTLNGSNETYDGEVLGAIHYNGFVYVSHSGFLTKLDAGSLVEAARLTVNVTLHREAPLAADGVGYIYIAEDNAVLLKIDADDLSIVDSYSYSNVYSTAQGADVISGGDGYVYTSIVYSGGELQDTLKIDPSTMSSVWTLSYAFVSSLTWAEGSLYNLFGGFSSPPQYIDKVDDATGNLLESVEESYAYIFPVTIDGYLYVARYKESEDGDGTPAVTKVSADTLIEEGSPGFRSHPPTILGGDGNLYGADNGVIKKADPETLTVIDEFTMESSSSSQFAERVLAALWVEV